MKENGTRRRTAWPRATAWDWVSTPILAHGPRRRSASGRTRYQDGRVGTGGRHAVSSRTGLVLCQRWFDGCHGQTCLPVVLLTPDTRKPALAHGTHQRTVDGALGTPLSEPRPSGSGLPLSEPRPSGSGLRKPGKTRSLTVAARFVNALSKHVLVPCRRCLEGSAWHGHACVAMCVPRHAHASVGTAPINGRLTEH